ncbi:MAG: hypothetical protein ACREHE_05975 [Rhizomicrobium sp.]
MYYYIPQNSWGLVDQAHYQTAGFYSSPGGACRPAALWCQAAQRGAYTHFDGNVNAISQSLVQWLANNNAGNTIDVYCGDADYANDLLGQITAIAYCPGAVVANANPDGYWGCDFTDVGPVWVDDTGIDEDEKVRAPDNWSDYWDDAPDWIPTGTFTSAIVDQLQGFFANYNGQFYFDFH